MGDEPNDQLAVPSLRAERWFKRRRRVIVIVVVLAAIGGFLYWFPSWALERADDKWIECTNQIYRTGTGTASDCEQGGLLAIPKLIPWTRKKALEVEARIHAHSLEDAIDLATKRDVDRAKA